MIKIQRGKKRDINLVWELDIENRKYHKSIGKKYSRLDRVNINKKAKEKFISDFKKTLKRRNIFFLVAKEKEKIIGYISGNIFEWSWSDNLPKIAKVDDVVVLRKFQRKRIATKLIKEFEKWAKSKKVYAIALNVWFKNKPAYSLYKKLKFDEHNIYMVKKI